MSELPDPKTVRGWTDEAATAAHDSVNLLVTSPSDGDPLAGIERTRSEGTGRERSDERGESTASPIRYTGRRPAAAGLLAAAAAVARNSPVYRLQYPSMDPTSDGPWIVLEPTGGALGTVSTGRLEVRIEMERVDGNVSESLTVHRNHLATLLDTAVPSHEHYPVESDDEAVFTTGMTTYELSNVEVNDRLTVSLTATTTPATTPESIRDRFTAIPDVRSVEIHTVRPVSRSDPDDRLRTALESAATETIGDYRYEWLPTPTGLQWIPSSNKIVFGAGHRGTPFSIDSYETVTGVLERTLRALGGER